MGAKGKTDIIIDGIVYKRKKIKFRQLFLEEGAVCIQMEDALPASVDELLFFDANRNGRIDVQADRMNGDQLVCVCGYPEMEDYDGRVWRYVMLAIDKSSRCAYCFVPSQKPAVDPYDHMKDILCKEQLGAARDGQTIEALFYVSDTEEALKLAIQPEYARIWSFLEGKVQRLSLKNGKLSLNIILPDYGYKIRRIYMQLRSAMEDIQYDFHFSSRYEKGAFVILADIDLSLLSLAQFYWDIKGEAEKDGVVYGLSLTNRERWMHRILYLKQLHYVYPDGNIVYPYKAKSNNLALQFRPRSAQDSRAFVMKEYVALVIYYLMHWWLKHRHIWIVYEKYCVMAQDNGYYFFKYCMEQLPEKEKKRIYYVIDKKSSDYQYVQKYGKQVIDFLSLKHMVFLMGAELLISSDTKAHAYAWHSPNSVYRNMLKRKKNVFLQHGVISFKCCHQGLRKKSVNASNLFVVSSDEEKQILLDYFGYEENEIIVTGLARWDVLTDKSAGSSRQIILMPTWRTWLEEVSEEVFVASDYYRHYMALLNHPVLIETLEKYQITLNFYIHPKFREYIGAFEASSDLVRLIPFGSEPLNELMMHCSMMITDYSSAVWDVFYQGKPVLFYLFDIDLYNEVQGSYIDMKTEAFGDVAYTPEELSNLIREYAENGFCEKPSYRAMRSKKIRYIDNNNSERTYQEIMKRFK